MTAAETCLAHLVWAPLGASVLEEFLRAYRRHPAGLAHRFVVILNGFEGPRDQRLVEIDRVLEGVDHERVVTPRAVLDLAAYRHAAEALDTTRLCFLNSYSRPRAAGWLALLDAPLADPAVGVCGASGSHESLYSAAPFWLRRRRRRDFPPFPNPHLRSNSFALTRELALSLDWPPPAGKLDAWRLESGWRSITRQVLDSGLQALVAGRDGVAYPPERWAQSATYRSGEQRNLLVADNRTLQYEQARPARKRQLALMTWGAAA